MLHRLVARATVIASLACFAAGDASAAGDSAVKISICHGFGCFFKSELNLGAADGKRFSRIMAAGASSPKAERAAVSKAVRYYEDRAAQVIGRRDQPKSNAKQYAKRGQMDCIDESTNTRSLLLYLERRGLLKHHTVNRNVTRGFLLDRRYPHSTAVLREKTGKKWTVDSWYEPMGGPPDIMPLSDWMKRGVMGVR